jgi:hypothetical protein
MSGCCAKEEEAAEEKVKGKFQPVTCNEDTEGEYSYGSTLSLTSALNGVGARGGVVVKDLRYKPAGRGFDSPWCHWNFSVT